MTCSTCEHNPLQAQNLSFCNWYPIASQVCMSNSKGQNLCSYGRDTVAGDASELALLKETNWSICSRYCISTRTGYCTPSKGINLSLDAWDKFTDLASKCSLPKEAKPKVLLLGNLGRWQRWWAHPKLQNLKICGWNLWPVAQVSASCQRDQT